jgi:cell shape-determining protein MreC
LNKREFFSYCLYFLLCAFLLVAQTLFNITPRAYVQPVLNPVFQVYEGTLGLVESSLQYLQSRKELLRRVDRLEEQNRRLQQDVYRGKAALRENEQLREYLDLPQTESFAVKPAEIIRRNTSGWERTFRINRGDQGGVRSDQLVLESRGDTWIIRGKVLSTSPHQSTVVLNTDPRFKIGVRVEEILGREFVARGWGHRGLRIENFPPFLSIDESRRVFTAPSSVLAPREFLLGRVVGVEQDRENRVGRRIQIQPPELTDREIVWVVTDHD